MQFLCANIYIHSAVDHILTSPVFASRYLKFNLKLCNRYANVSQRTSTLQNGLN